MMTTKDQKVLKAYKDFCRCLNENNVPHIVTMIVDGKIKGNAGGRSEADNLTMVKSIIRNVVKG